MITPFYSENSDLLVGVDKSSLKANAVTGADTLEVYSINKFAINYVLLIGELGGEGSEIVSTHTSTAPAGTTITLANVLVKDHPKDTSVYIIPYNQVEFSHADTATGTKSVLDTYTIDPEREGNRHSEATETAGFVFTRFKNSLTGAYSNYSDAYPFTGLDMNTVGYLVKKASKGLDPDNKVPFEDKISFINEGLRFIRGELKRWNTFQEFDYVVDQTVDGTFEYDMPDTIYDKNSNKSVLSVKIENYRVLKYMDKRELNEQKQNESDEEGEPTHYTVYDGKLALYPKPDSNFEDLDIIMDFYTDIVEVDSDADVLTLLRFDMLYRYLRWEIRNETERNGKSDLTDGDYIRFREILAKAIKRETSGQKFKMKPRINRIADARGNNLPFDRR